MAKEYLYWENRMIIQTSKFYGTTLEVYRQDNFYICDYYHLTKNEVRAIIMINGERSWDDVLDFWMQSNKGTKEVEDMRLREILSNVEERCDVSIKNSEKILDKEIKFYLTYDRDAIDL